MSKGHLQLPRIKPVGRAALNRCPPPQRARHPHWDSDLAYGMPETAGHAWENWPQRETTTPYVIASAAWAGYLTHPQGGLRSGRGLTIVDTRKTYPVPTGLGHAISYLPANLVPAADEAHCRASHGARVMILNARWWLGWSHSDHASQRRRRCLSSRQPAAHAEAGV